MDKITHILENVVRCKYFEAGVHIKNPMKNSYQDGLGRTTQTLDHVVVVHILIWDKRKSQINEYSDDRETILVRWPWLVPTSIFNVICVISEVQTWLRVLRNEWCQTWNLCRLSLKWSVALQASVNLWYGISAYSKMCKELGITKLHQYGNGFTSFAS